MSQEREKILSMLKSLHFSEGKMSKEYTFTIECVDMFYYKNNIGANDIKTQFVDGSNDGGIDYIYTDGESLYLIQGKSTDRLSFNDIRDCLTKMAYSSDLLKKGKATNISDNVKSAFINAYDDLPEDKNIELVVFTNTALSGEDRKRIEQLEKESDALKGYSISIYGKDEIEIQKANVDQGTQLVDEGELYLFLGQDKAANRLLFGDGNGMIVNIKASSLKKLYEKYSNNGLFSYNLREHITQKTVDDAIENTIKKDRKNFWYYNNGITIGCNDYRIDGYKLVLYGFSIINGAQTTTKIGRSNIISEENDMVLSCKIVKAGNTVESDEDFISKISEASNSQKPIKPRDLKANTREQKVLQNKAANNKYPLAIEIKRGVKL